MMKFLYTDASFSKKDKTGVAGFVLFNNEEDQSSGNIASSVVKTIVIKEENNVRVELKSVILALEYCIADTPIELYTDSRSVTDLLSRREKLEASGYVSKNKNKVLSNADLYKKLFQIYDRVHPDIHWIKGHAPKNEQDQAQKNFSYIDRLVRKKLRDLLR
jgi:ribonuclease HI